MIKLLVADDEDLVRAFFRTVIEKEKLPVSLLLEADNGLEAIRLAREHSPDLILLDIRMPGLNGLKACAVVQKELPQTEVVIISAYDEFDYARSAFTSGARDFLVKPISPQQAAALINRVAGDKGRAKKEAEEEQPVHPLVQEVRKYAEKNLDRDFGLNELADAVFISPSHLSRKFKKITGRSVSAFIQEIKIARATEMMYDNTLSITEIAGMVGFNNPGYFATCFKALTGRTPTQYRLANNDRGQ